MIEAIAFDADDTLWHTELFYREAEQALLKILTPYHVSQDEFLSVLHRIEIDNLAYFGYGIRGFILSMIETAVKVTRDAVHAEDIQAIVELGRGMTVHEIRLLDGAKEALSELAERNLLLITKGDALDQESKIKRSGLANYFKSIEIVVDKTQAAYADLLARHAIRPENFLMIGNSLRSDISPVLALGAYAVFVPYPNDWAHESAADLPADRSRFYEIPSLRSLADLIAKIDQLD
ncbi:MAG TPA: HAD family hydrolase [Anaerolineaceae bacterium]|nr:HAD family hydrolase [Anaerolineaceae bacterium]